MRIVNLFVVGLSKSNFKTLCYNRLIRDFLQNTLRDEITMDDFKISSVFGLKANFGQVWMVIDSKCNPLPLYADVPDKLMVILIDISKLSLLIEGLEELEPVKILNQYFIESYGFPLSYSIGKPDLSKEIKSSSFLKEIIKLSAVAKTRKELPREEKIVPEVKPEVKIEPKKEQPKVTKPKVVPIKPTKTIAIEPKKVSKPLTVKVFNIPKKPVTLKTFTAPLKVVKPITFTKPKKVIKVEHFVKPQLTFKNIKKAATVNKKETTKPLKPLVKLTKPKVIQKVSKPVSKSVSKPVLEPVKPSISKPTSTKAKSTLEVKPKRAEITVKLNHDGTSKVMTAFDVKPKTVSKPVIKTDTKPVIKPKESKIVKPEQEKKPVTKKEVKPKPVVFTLGDITPVKEPKVLNLGKPMEVKNEKVKEEKQTLLVDDSTTNDKKTESKTTKTTVKKGNKPVTPVKPLEPIQSIDLQPKVQELKQEPKKELKQEQPKKLEEQEMFYQVVSPEGEVLYTKSLKNQQPMTVEQILMQSGLNINNSRGFIEGINGINNQGMSGWVFEVNHAPVMVAASDFIVSPFDEITWKYVDFSKNLEDEHEVQKEAPSKTLIKQPLIA